MLTREQILNRKVKVKRVPVPEYGDYYLRVLSMNESLKLDAAVKESGSENAAPFIIAARLCDENGNQLLNQPGDEKLIGDLLDTPVATALLDVINAENPKTVEDKAVTAKN